MATVRPPRVYLIRHGKAEREHAHGDAARRLSPDGRARFQKLLAEAGPSLKVLRILTSPFARTRQTADLLAAAVHAPVEEVEELAPGRSTGRELLRLARGAGDGTAVVGHNPDVAEAIAIAAGHTEEVKPGTIAAVELHPDGPKLAWLRRPPRED
ncbi:MAG: histidine phosphatase family protein [Deltaproteobacteria bacterium]|nr:histidine phosphatase family protein [Deltaproteobacteria bacterium]